MVTMITGLIYIRHYDEAFSNGGGEPAQIETTAMINPKFTSDIVPHNNYDSHWWMFMNNGNKYLVDVEVVSVIVNATWCTGSTYGIRQS